MNSFQKQTLAALQAAITLPGTNNEEIMVAIQALQQESPIAGKRARRAICNRMAEAIQAGTDIHQDTKDLLHGVIGEIDDQGGVLPRSDGKTSHLHLRIEGARKGTYMAAAKKRHMTLSEWCVTALDDAAKAGPEAE